MRHEILKDFFKKNLKIVFVGTAASNISASKKHYYANPRNFFWKLLCEAGLTDRQLSPEEDYLLVYYGFGLTDVAKFVHGSDSNLSTESLRNGRKPLETKIRKHKPKVVCFTSKNAYKAFVGNNAKSYGLQPPVKNWSSKVFLVPSPSPQVMSNRKMDGKTRLEWFKELANFIKNDEQIAS